MRPDGVLLSSTHAAPSRGAGAPQSSVVQPSKNIALSFRCATREAHDGTETPRVGVLVSWWRGPLDWRLDKSGGGFSGERRRAGLRLTASIKVRHQTPILVVREPS
jgi:hypothetical protein